MEQKLPTVSQDCIDTLMEQARESRGYNGLDQREKMRNENPNLYAACIMMGKAIPDVYGSELMKAAAVTTYILLEQSAEDSMPQVTQATIDGVFEGWRLSMGQVGLVERKQMEEENPNLHRLIQKFSTGVPSQMDSEYVKAACTLVYEAMDRTLRLS